MLRSMLFRPGDSLKKMKKGAAGPADALILDLEDSVAEMNRPAARTPCAGFSCGTGVSIESAVLGARLSTHLVDQRSELLMHKEYRLPTWGRPGIASERPYRSQLERRFE